MKWNAQIISHTHWDREWYLNSKYTNEWLVPFFDSLFKMFEKEEGYQFVLDGQMSMIDDYFEELSKLGKPVYYYKNLIRKYVNEGRLFIGPYYLQPDWQLISEEALVRNLVIGNAKSKEFGECMDIGWMLDNFGQISQTSQIHANADIKGLYVWRGVEMPVENVQSEFLWESPDGTVLPSVYLVNSYRNVMRLAEYKDIMKDRILDEVNKLKPFMTTSNILMMNGYDQEMVPDDIQPLLKTGEINTEDITVTQSNPKRYLQSVLDEKPDLLTLKGALYSGRFISVFPGVMSSRMYLKLQNDRSQKLIEKYAEPLAFLDFAMGGDYDKSSLDKAWELLLKNHPHDSICGVSIDDVHSDMETRTRDFRFIIDYVIRKNITNLAKRINTSNLNDINYFVYNPATYQRKEVLTIENKDIEVDVNPFGYTYVDINKMPTKTVTVNKNIVENDFIKVRFNDDGTLDLFDKINNTNYKGLGKLVDSSDAGDEYNYSYCDNEKYFYSTDSEVDINIIHQSDLKVIVELRYDMHISKGLTEDRKSRLEETLAMPVRTVVTITAHSSRVEFKTEILNTVKDHIVRVLFPTKIETDHAMAGSPFDVVKRPIHIDDYDESMIPENVRRVIVGAREAKPNTIFLGREMVDLSDGKKGLAMLSKGLPEYTVLKEDTTFALTLFRSVNWVANDINTRIGDAGPLIYTPEAECLRQETFEYAIYPHKGNYEEGGVVRQADEFNNELMTFVTDKHEGELPVNNSFISIDGNNNIRITSINRSKDNKSLIIRLYNPSEREISSTINIQGIKKAYSVNFLEKIKEELNIEKNSVPLKVGAKKILTIKLVLDDNFYKQVVVNDKAFADIYEYETIYDFSKYESVPLVSQEDIDREWARANELLSKIEDPLYRRTALEAQLSAVLTQDRYNEMLTYDLGWGLNEARVKRRVYDYIQDILKKKRK